MSRTTNHDSRGGADLADGASLPHERLQVYRVALELHAAALELLPQRGSYAVRDQLERASMSVVLNIAEGAGRTTGPDKKRFFDIARASATECAAIFDVIRLRRGTEAAGCRRARVLAVRVVQMLSRLSANLS